MTERYKRREPSREARRAQFKRRVRLKKIAALSVLFVMLAVVVGVVGGGVFAVIKFIKSRKMVEEPYTAAHAQSLVLVDNTNNSSGSGASGEYDYFAELRESSEADEDDEEDYFDFDESSYYADISQISGGEKGLIVVDAGHGGKDSGALGFDMMEKDLVLQIAKETRKALLARDYSVYMTRVDDSFVGLKERARIANSLEPLLMVSIHLNSYPELESVAGVEAWTYERSGCIELAEMLTEQVSKATGVKNRGVYYATNLVVTSKTTMPSVILECGYITNEEEATNLSTGEYQKKIASGVAKAVEKFVEEYY